MSEAKAPYVLKKSEVGSAQIDKALGHLIGKIVCVSWVLDREKLRANFEPQISVQAVLEGDEGTGRYRVLLSDDTYSYFYDHNVWSVARSKPERAFIFIG
tara:strand:- start:2409 stop:2708 length:300 start_codon:yes stop_codon:yes gene_type:complete